MNISIFWASMIQMFGSMWVRERGEQPNQMWQALIADHDSRTIEAVINHFKCSGHPFPPTLSEAGAIAKMFKGSVPGPGPVLEKPRPLPSEKEADEKIKKVFDSLQSGQKRRTTFFPGESFKSHEEAWAAAFKNGKTRAEFEAERLQKNGWTEADEAFFNRWKAGIINCVPVRKREIIRP